MMIFTRSAIFKRTKSSSGSKIPSKVTIAGTTTTISNNLNPNQSTITPLTTMTNNKKNSNVISLTTTPSKVIRNQFTSYQTPVSVRRGMKMTSFSTNRSLNKLIPRSFFHTTTVKRNEEETTEEEPKSLLQYSEEQVASYSEGNKKEVELNNLCEKLGWEFEMEQSDQEALNAILEKKFEKEHIKITLMPEDVESDDQRPIADDEPEEQIDEEADDTEPEDSRPLTFRVMITKPGKSNKLEFQCSLVEEGIAMSRATIHKEGIDTGYILEEADMTDDQYQVWLNFLRERGLDTSNFHELLWCSAEYADQEYNKRCAEEVINFLKD